MVKTVWFALLSLLCFWTGGELGAAPQGGTLIVTYHTGSKGERLDRVRFWIRNEQWDQALYPKSGGFLDDPVNLSRMVVIENLPEGNYTLQFVVSNCDGLFQEMAPRQFTMTSGGVIKIDQTIKPLYTNVKGRNSTSLPKPALAKQQVNEPDNQEENQIAFSPLPPEPQQYAPLTAEELNSGKEVIEPQNDKEGNGADSDNTAYYRRPTGEIIIKGGRRVYNYGYGGQIPYEGRVSIRSELPGMRWTLFHFNNILLTGKGTREDIYLPPGGGYRVEAEKSSQYETAVYPPGVFNIVSGSRINVAIEYKPTYGYINVRAVMPMHDPLHLSLKPEQELGRTLQLELRPQGGAIDWQSNPLPTGSYLASWHLPKYYEAIAAEKIVLRHGEHLILTPQLIPARSLKVTTNSADATFELKRDDGLKSWSGSGQQHTFEHLLPGSYTLSFGSSAPEVAIPPEERRVDIGKYNDNEVKGIYGLTGRVRIETNLSSSRVMMEEIGGQHRTFDKEIKNYSSTFNLPEGYWRVSVLPTAYNDDGSPKFNSIPKPVTVKVRPQSQEQLSFNIALTKASKETDETAAPQQEQNTTADTSPEASPLIAEVALPQLLKVPEGESIVGDTFDEGRDDEIPATKVFINGFSTGKYEVTNAQYASWLNSAIREKKIVYFPEGARKGQVVDSEGKLFFKAWESDPYSQIQVMVTPSDHRITFVPIVGKEDYPVIDVTWWGAQAYCHDNGFRLPTEAEWEKAAGMALTKPGEPLKKYKYGFAQDVIDKTWANYKDNEQRITRMKVLTMPVGFYDGKNKLPLDIGDTTQWPTNDATSPVGAYDMSGNVWEWCSDWYSAIYFEKIPRDNPQGPDTGTQKVAKGGCYDSLTMGVRVAERLSLYPDWCDPYTGFRIAQ